MENRTKPASSFFVQEGAGSFIVYGLVMMSRVSKEIVADKMFAYFRKSAGYLSPFWGTCFLNELHKRFVI